MDSKICKRCHIVKLANEFPTFIGTNNKVYFKGSCKLCEGKYKRKWYLENHNKGDVGSRINYKLKNEKLKLLGLKICTKCNESKPIDRFYNNKNSRNKCKSCQSNSSKKYYIENSEKIKQEVREYSLKNKEKIIKYKKEYEKDKLKTDPIFKLIRRMRTRLGHALKGDFKLGSAVKSLGCATSHFKSYIERQFQPGMSWNNYGKWELDHITPLSKFDLTDSEQFKVAWHYTNYQPLWRWQNIIKSDQIMTKEEVLCIKKPKWWKDI